MSGPDCEKCGEYFLDCKCMAGRPEAKIDWNQVTTWLREGRTGPQIASTLGISRDCLYDRCLSDNNTNFSEFSQDKKAIGDGELHTAQFKKAMRGDSNMLKHLGEWRLGQKEKKNEQSNNDSGIREFVAWITKISADRPELLELLQSFMATQQPVFHQGHSGEQDQIQNELGPEGTL